MISNRQFSGPRAVIAMLSCSAALAACTQAPAGEAPAPAADAKNPPAAAEPAPSFNPTGLPIVKERITLKMVAAQSPLHGEWKDKLLWKEAEKQTGIHVEWELIPQANLEEKKNLLLAGGTYPDAFYGGGITNQDLINYGEQGVFLPLNELIDKYAPNFKKVVQAHPEILRGLTAPDGKIYSLPKMSVNPTHLMGPKMFINQKWLDALQLQMPSTTEELYQVLKAFKEQDPNRNGQADEIPMSNNITSAYWAIAGAYGLNNRGAAHAYVDIEPNTEKLRFVPTAPKYKEVMEYMHKLYSEGLLDPEIFTNTVPILTAKIMKDQVGSFNAGNTVPAGQKRVDFKGLPQALKGPHGDQLWAGMNPTLLTHGAFVITKANKHPEASIRWADHFIDGEGAVLYWMGVEGKTYEMKDGKYRFVQDIANNPNGLTLDQAISRELVAPFTNHPIVREERFSWDTGEGLPEVIEAAGQLQPYLPKEVWPAFLHTQQENERMIALSNDINKYVAEMRTQFITGKAPMSKWDEYVATIKKMGLDEYMAIYQAAYDRYSKVK